jgi:uncharacterized protein YodC (DUF2158 family)
MTGHIKHGDVVEPQSGGSNRSVARIEDQDGALSARCNWLDGHK